MVLSRLFLLPFLISQHLGKSMIAHGTQGVFDSSSFSFFQESEPISRYLHTEVATELRQRLAKMGMDMLLKMVGT